MSRVNTCAHEGCNARCLSPHTLCSRHREQPKPSRGPRLNRRFRRDPETEAKRVEILRRAIQAKTKRLWENA